jgi:hypothetical protein
MGMAGWLAFAVSEPGLWSQDLQGSPTGANTIVYRVQLRF